MTIFLEFISPPNHCEPVNTSDDDIYYSSLGYNAKTLSDVILLYQEEIKDYPREMTAVDLGLSVKWSSCNLGALAPELYGDQYAWGEITAKDSFTPENYKFGGAHSNPNSYWDYLGCIKYNDKDEKYFLDSEDDAAHVKLGEDWRIPSPEEWQELIENCVWKWTSFHDAVGVVGTSKINGKCIFFPADSSFRNGSLESGIYHSSQVVASNNHEFAGYYYNDYGQSIDVSFPSPTEDILGFFSQLRYDGAAPLAAVFPREGYKAAQKDRCGAHYTVLLRGLQFQRIRHYLARISTPELAQRAFRIYIRFLHTRHGVRRVHPS